MRDRQTCIGCGKKSPETETNYTLISSQFGWRLTRSVGADGVSVVEWRCPNCWRDYKKVKGGGNSPSSPREQTAAEREPPTLPKISAAPEVEGHDGYLRAVAAKLGAPALNDDSLARFGYAQQLLRSMGGFSSFALSFSVISVLTGVFATYVHGLERGGPFGLVFGWGLVAAGTLVVAVAMAELASAFPTAGALYHWAALLGGRGWGWLTATMNLVGQIAIVGAIDLACAQTLEAALGWGGARASYVLFAIILASHAALNVVSIRLVARLNDISAIVHLVGVAAIVVGLLAFGPRRPIATLLAGGGHGAFGFAEALVVGMWTMTGFDASAHVSEETHRPELRAAWGIVTAVGVSAVAGLLLVVALALGGAPPAWATALVVGAMWFCGLSSVTSASRMLFAFARDGGFPGASHVRKVDARFGTPVVAIGVATVAPLALVMATAPWSDRVFLSIATLATTALYVSYAVPIGLGAVARSDGRWRRKGAWNLGRQGVTVAWGAVVWGAVVIGVSAIADRLSAALLGGTALTLLGLWQAHFKRAFAGPAVHLEDLERPG